jgi:hypothetical protein
MPTAGLFGTAIGLTAWAIFIRAVAANSQAANWMVLGVLILFALGCSYPDVHVVDWLVWCSAGTIIFCVPPATRVKKESLLQRRSVATDGYTSDEKVLQQYSRARSADGKETISGTLVAEFALGERQVTLYAGFCPPFELLPQVEASVADDFEAEVKLVQVLHNGAQIDVRLDEPAEEPVTVAIEFVAVG